MTTYAQFCPVAKAAEVFGDRWTPIIVRELCFGTRSFGELLEAAPLISRTVLAQRLKQLEQSGVVHIEPKPSGKGHLYRLTPAGEDFRSIAAQGFIIRFDFRGLPKSNRSPRYWWLVLRPDGYRGLP
jgi:DNA-binding HxlR family transcriptional regulator